MIKKLKEISNSTIKKGIVDENKIITIYYSGDLKKDFYTYANNFRKAGWQIANEMVEGADISKLDSLFFPLTFLYRHSIELVLKAIAFKYIDNDLDRISFLKKTFHNLSTILEIIEPFIEAHIAKDNKAHVWVKQLLSSMNEIDKESDSFRYPFRILREDFSEEIKAKVIFENQTHINLISLVNKMEITFEILESYYNENVTVREDYKDYKPMFLEEGGTYYGQSVIGYKYNKADFYLYTKAYKNTANFLHSEVENDYSKKNLLFFPLSYLYRNAIELSLKDVIFELYSGEVALKMIVDKKHSLYQLWNCIEQGIIEHTGSSKNDETILYYRTLIIELHDYDATADKFRYPIDKNLKTYFESEKKYDIDSFNRFFNEILDFLSGVSGMISHHNEVLAEYEREMRNSIDY